MGYYKDNWDALTEKTRKIIQIALGIVLAIASFSLLFLFGDDGNAGSFDFNTVLAFAIALVLPRVFESAVGGKLPLLKRALLITMAAELCLFVFLAFVIKPPWLPTF